MNKAAILIGSNIKPEKNIKDCLLQLNKLVTITSYSSVWITKSFGNDGPNFLNLAVNINTLLLMNELKTSVIQTIEDQLGRIRLPDKYAPRTIDLDVIIFNGKVVDVDVWIKGFVALPISELMPNLKHKSTNVLLSDIAKKLKSSEQPELFYPPANFFPN